MPGVRGGGVPLWAGTGKLDGSVRAAFDLVCAASKREAIGTGLTSGCVAFLMQDMLHLYDRTPVQTKVVVLKA